MQQYLIRLRLEHLLDQITDELTKLLPASSLPQAPSNEHAQLHAKLIGWEAALSYLNRDLWSARNLLEVERKRAAQIPREHRFSARQSIEDRSRDLDMFLRQTQHVLGQFWRLRNRVWGPTLPEIESLLHSLWENLIVEPREAIQKAQQLMDYARVSGTEVPKLLPGSSSTATPAFDVWAAVPLLLTLVRLGILAGYKKATPQH